MKRDFDAVLRPFFLELAVYAGLVAGYFFLVLHLLGGWLDRLFITQRGVYAVVGLALIVGQGLLLEWLTRLLLAWVGPPPEDS